MALQSKDTWAVCKWNSCSFSHRSGLEFSEHVKKHLPYLEIVTHINGSQFYKCLWLNCIFQTNNDVEIMFHVSYHAFHALLRVKGDSYARANQLPPCILSTLECDAIPNRETPLICQWDDCNESLTGIVEFINHVNVSHLLLLEPKHKKDFKCLWSGCSFSATKRSLLSDHAKTHTGDKFAECSQCGQMFANSSKFSNHRNKQLPITDESPQCSHCLIYLPSDKQLKIHMRQHVHHYKCSYCELTCTTPAILSAHIKYRHLPFKPFKCSACEHVCKSQSDLNRHLYTHTQPMFTCSQPGCNSKYRTEYSLTKHFEKVHTENGLLSMYACHLCDKEFPRGALLTNHLCSVHKVTKPSGYSRFGYRREKDGYFRLQTTRLESLEVEEMTVAFEYVDSKEMTDEDVDNPTPITRVEDEVDAEDNRPITIDAIDDKGRVISCQVITSEIALPPEAKIVAVGE